MALDRYDISRDGKTIVDKTTNKPLRMFKSNKYLQCCICDENGMHVMGVHSIVAQKYISDWFDGCNVHHKDHNTQNNNIDNLECLKPSEHTKLHNPVKYKDKKVICPRCKKNFCGLEKHSRTCIGTNRRQALIVQRIVPEKVMQE